MDPRPASALKTRMADRNPVPRVVILGGGFGGLAAARALRKAPAEVTLVDRQNHHCFQPLLYQVATAALTPADVAWPIRSVLRDQRNARVLMAAVETVYLEARIVRTSGGDLPFDYLVVATGATHTYFGRDEWSANAPGLKRVEDATAIRNEILMAYERAELSDDEAVRRALTPFLVIGGGPTGVEMAGAIADVARNALPPDFRRVDPRASRVMLVEAGPRLLSAFPEALSRYAEQALRRMGIEVRTGAPVTAIEPGRIVIGEGEAVAAGAVIWAAGVKASPAAAWLDAEADRAGRVKVDPNLGLPGRPGIYVIGDVAAVVDEAGRPVPGVAPAAKQMGDYVGKAIAVQIKGRAVANGFRYRHQGDLATIGRKVAIARLPGVTLTGLAGWLFWSVAHVYFLIGARSRIAVAFSWLWDYVTFGRRSRLITAAAPSESSA